MVLEKLSKSVPFFGIYLLLNRRAIVSFTLGIMRVSRAADRLAGSGDAAMQWWPPQLLAQ